MIGVHLVLGYCLDDQIKSQIMGIDPDLLADVIYPETDYGEELCGLSLLYLGADGVDRCCGVCPDLNCYLERIKIIGNLIGATVLMIAEAQVYQKTQHEHPLCNSSLGSDTTFR